MIDVNKMGQHLIFVVQRCIDNAHGKGQLSSALDIPQLRQLKPFLEQMANGLHTVNGKVGCKLDRLFSCRKTWLKSRWSSPKRKMTIKNIQSLRILMASGLRLTYMSEMDMHSVPLKVRDIQVWQPSMAPALVQSDNNFRKSVMICQIIDSVNNHFGEYL